MSAFLPSAVSKSPPTQASIANSRQASVEQSLYQIVHVTEGRFRIRIPRLMRDEAYGSQLTWLIESWDFIISVRVNTASGSLIIHFQPTTAIERLQMQLAQAVQQADAIEVPLGAIHKTEFRPAINWVERLALPTLSLGVALVAQQILVPLPLRLALGGLVMAAATPFFLRLADLTLKQGKLDPDVLDALWLTIYTIKGDFVSPALMVSMIETGEALRDATARASERQFMDLMSGISPLVRVERDGQELQVSVKEVQRGDRVVVYAGETIPVSGRVLRGTALIDEHKLTGESHFVSRSEGQVVHAATQMIQGKLVILTKRVGANTRVGVTVQLLQNAPVHDTRVEDYSAKMADATIAPMLLLSAGIFAFTGNFARALAPLHLDFGHNIRIAVPSTVLSALTYAARQGIYIRSGRALELLSRIDTIVFDKTGTLTQGRAAVLAIKSAKRHISRTEVLQVAASAEQESNHPVANAIRFAAEAQNLALQPCEAWDYKVGFGVIAQINGQRVLVGSDRLLQQENIDLQPLFDRYPDLQDEIASRVYVARNGKLLGMISYTDPARSESASVIASLHEQNQQTYMLTGDSQRVARHVAHQLGIPADRIYAEAFPDRKVDVIRQLQAAGRTVAFIGEGINDAAALAHADVSISIASGIDLARETADIILLDDDLRGIPHAIAIAKRAMDIVYQNTALIALPNISTVLAGVFFALDPMLSIIISNGAALLAELNSFRPLFTSEQDAIDQWFAENLKPVLPTVLPQAQTTVSDAAVISSQANCS